MAKANATPTGHKSSAAKSATKKQKPSKSIVTSSKAIVTPSKPTKPAPVTTHKKKKPVESSDSSDNESGESSAEIPSHKKKSSISSQSGEEDSESSGLDAKRAKEDKSNSSDASSESGEDASSESRKDASSKSGESASSESGEGESSESDEDSKDNSKDESSGSGDDTKEDAEAQAAHSKGKRKADSQSAAPAKKAKMANGDAAQAPVDQEAKDIFVGKLSWNVDDEWLSTEFAECGEVVSAHVQMDRNTGKSRGFGYVHFATAEAAQKALALDGKEIDGRPIHVDVSTPLNKDKARENRANAFGDKTNEPSATLFVGNLSFDTVEDTLYEAFGEHGNVKSVRIITDRETNTPKGFGYIEFTAIKDAANAFKKMKGKEIDGRSLRLDFSRPRDAGGFGMNARGRGGGGEFRGRGGRGGRGGFGGFSGRGDDRGRGRGNRGRGAGGIAPFQGKRTKF